MLAVTAIAWAAVFAIHAIPSTAARHVMPGMPMGHDMAGMVMPPGMAMPPGMSMDRHAAAFPGSALALLAFWPLMLVAMMTPLLLPALRHVYTRSLPTRRWRAMTLLAAVYLGIWWAAGVLLQAVAAAMQAVLPGGTAIAFGLVIAVVWQLSPVKQRCLNRLCAHPPLAAFGRAADLAVLRFGCVHTLWCVGSCWVLMLLPLLAGGWHLIMMAMVTVWIWAEPFDTPTMPSWRLRLPIRAARIIAARPFGSVR